MKNNLKQRFDFIKKISSSFVVSSRSGERETCTVYYNQHVKSQEIYTLKVYVYIFSYFK